METPLYNDQPRSSGREQLEQALDLLYRRKWIAILTFVLVTGLTALYTYTIEPEYEAYSFVMLELENRKQTTSDKDDFSPGDNLFARNDRTLAGELQILQLSTKLQQRVYQRMVDSLAANAPGDETPIPEPNGYVLFLPAGQGGVDIIQMTGISTVPADAARLANLYAEEYVLLTREASRAHITASRILLEDQETQRREELRLSEENVRSYLRSEGATGLDEEGSHLIQQIALLEAERDNARIELQMRESALTTSEEEIAKINPQLARRIASRVNQQIEELHDQIADKEDLRRDILRRVGQTNNPAAQTELQAIEREINDLQARVSTLSTQYVEEVEAAGGIASDQEGLSYVGKLRQQIIQDRITINGLKAKIEVMNNRLGVYQTELRAIPEQSLELARLERERLYAERMHESVVERLQDTRLAEESEPGYAYLLREAYVPFEPARPNINRYLLLGLVGGIFFGLAFAFMRDKLDNRIFQPDQLREKGFKVIGTIPDMAALIKEELQGRPFIETDGLRLSSSMVTLLAPVSPIAEAYRHVRTNIQFSRPDTVVQTLLLTSASVEEGKTTTSSNLAVTMAKAGRRTLLIDADLRRPRIHELFGLELGPGLVQFLCHNPSFTPGLIETGIDNLYVMPAGRVVARSSELLATKRMRDFLEELREQFDTIIIDTPPIRVATDAALLSTQCDATILVTRAGQTKEGEVELALENLSEVGAHVIGAVLNGFDVSMAFGHKYRYQEYTRYAQYSKDGNYGYAEEDASDILDKL